MTKQRWTTEKQRTWLEERIPGFLEAQSSDTVSDVFFPEIHKLWATEFPHPEPSPEQIEKANGNREKASALLIKQTEKRISQWYHNNTRPSATKQPIIKLKHSTKIMADWQAYQSLYYEKKLKAMVDEEYAKHRKGLKEGEKAKPRIKVQTEVVRAEYNKESNAVRAEVEAYRLKLKEESEGNLTSENKLESLANAIDRLPATLASMLKALQKETGWAFTVFAGGPSPQHDGKIVTYIMHEGTTAENATEQFENFVGKVEWNENILSRWDQFLHGVYPPDVRAARSLGTSSKQNTPEIVVEDGKDKDSTSPTQSTESGKNDHACSDVEKEDNMCTELDKETETSIEIVQKDDATEKVASRGGQSNYEIQKAKNIARNQELIAQLKEQYKVPTDMDEVSKVKGKKTKSDKGGKNGSEKQSGDDNARHNRHLIHSRPISALNDKLIVNASQSATATALPVHDVDLAEPQSTTAVADTIGCPQSTSSPDGIGATSARNTTSLNSPTSCFASKPDGDDATSTQNATDLDGLQLTSLISGSGTTMVDEDVIAGNATQSPCNSNKTDAMDIEQDGLGGVDDADTGKGKQVSENSEEMETDDVLEKPSALDSEAGTRTLRSGRGRGDKPDSTISKSRPPPSSSSAYITDTEPYLKDISANSVWLELVEKWVEFERVYPVKGNIATANRPGEIPWWLKRARKVKTIPFITDPDAYKDQWRRWWISMQPEWRISDAWPPSRAVPEGFRSWSILGHAGQNGLFLVIMALSWWGKAVDSDIQENNFLSAVEDVLWTIVQLISTINPKKRPADDDAEDDHKPVSKRARMSV